MFKNNRKLKMGENFKNSMGSPIRRKNEWGGGTNLRKKTEKYVKLVSYRGILISQLNSLVSSL